MADKTFVQDTVGLVDRVVESTTQEIWTSLAQNYSTTITTAFVLVLVLYGWGLWNGWVKGTWGEAFSNVLKIAFVYYLTMDWATFQQWFYQMFYVGADEIAKAVSNSAFGGKTAADALDEFAIKGFELAFRMFDGSNIITGLGKALVAIIVLLFVLVAVMMAMFFICVSKLGVAILLSVGVIFIAFLLFDRTRGWFDQWIGALLNYALVGILTVVLCKFLIGAGQEIVESMKPGGTTVSQAFWDVCAFIYFCGVFIGMLKFVPLIASSLASGLAMPAGGMMPGHHWRSRGPTVSQAGKAAANAGRAAYRWFRPPASVSKPQ